MLTYVGEGYGTAFVRNFDRTVERVQAEGDVDIVAGPDDLCAPILASPDCHCHDRSVTVRDRHASSDLATLLVTSSGRCTVNAEVVKRLRTAFAADLVRSACRHCPWDALCTDVASRGFAGVRLHPEAT